MSAMQVYLDARGAEATTGKAWDDANKLREIDQAVRADMGRCYRFLDKINARIGELDGPVALPKKASSRTDFQRGYEAGVRAAGVPKEAA